MYSDYDDVVAFESYIKKRMSQYRQDCLAALSGIVHPKYINKIAGVIAYAYDQDDIDALSLAEDLKLDKLNFMAVLDRDKDFINALFEEEERDYLDSLHFEEVIL